MARGWEARRQPADCLPKDELRGTVEDLRHWLRCHEQVSRHAADGSVIEHGVCVVGTASGHTLKIDCLADDPTQAVQWVYPALRAMYAKIGGADVGEADTLLWSTYVHLMSECEQYSDRSLPGGRKA